VSERAAAALIAAVVAAAVALDAGGAPRRDSGLEIAAARLSTKQLAGQRVIASFPGTKPPARLLAMVREGRIAGVIFFEENIAGRRKLAAVAKRLQRARARADLPAALRDTPLLLMVDQEGGSVRRLPGAPRRSQLQIGASGRPGHAAQKAGAGAGRNLGQAGLNVNLAPVLDVSRGPRGALEQSGRTYGRNPRKVGRLAARFIAGQARHGVAATVKHFPGLGAAEVSTDDAPVVIEASRGELRRVDEAPYEPAISAGAGLVMLSNAVYPALDRRPAGLSRRVIQGELRERVGFGGVTITDALEVPALDAFGAVAKRALRAARAGADLLLFASRRVADAQAGWKRIVTSLRGGGLDREIATESATRVLALRASAGG
jgi:beta-N-acetylhexosaminidase